MITFIHGWGCGPDIWTPIIRNLQAFECRTVDLGFTGPKTQSSSLNAQASVYVTHSLGTLWALKNRHEQMSALIVINGFSCFKDFTTLRMLKGMRLNLKRNAKAQMLEFWETTGLLAGDELNVTELDTGLEWLMNRDYTPQLKTLKCPVKTVFGDADPLLDFERMQNHWAGYEHHIFKGGGHNLPVTHPQECADIIKGAADGL